MVSIAINRLEGITTAVGSIFRKLDSPWKLFVQVSLRWGVSITMDATPVVPDRGALGCNPGYPGHMYLALEQQ